MLVTDGGRLEQNSASAVSTPSVTAEMDRRTDPPRYSASHASTPGGVRYVTAVGSSPRTPFDAGRHHNSFQTRDLAQFRPPSHVVYNPLSCAHSLPEATPFQAISAHPPPETGYCVTQNGSRPATYGWQHQSPTRGPYGGIAGAAPGGKTPWFRRTPGARRSEPREVVGGPSMIAPRPLFPPSASSGVRTTHATGTASLPFREFFDSSDPARGHQPVSTVPSYPARSNAVESAGHFDSVADGVELVISNLDYNISSHEWKKILTCELQQQVQVREVLPEP